ncbi:MAG TPA: type II toxin-antitoxin system RelE/ParE family toxin [Dongiaceae bacterium]|nr:type II toxin-antitoxin system RelE/ParE family toxin [Dongiaceae bacterium]
MAWQVEFHEEFEPEFARLAEAVQDEILALAILLEEYGPRLSRPHADTLKNSKFANMKELRLSADDGEWRVAFAFDSKRMAILLCAGDKSGISEKMFYRALIKKADRRFAAHQSRVSAAKGGR